MKHITLFRYGGTNERVLYTGFRRSGNDVDVSYFYCIFNHWVSSYIKSTISSIKPMCSYKATNRNLTIKYTVIYRICFFSYRLQMQNLCKLLKTIVFLQYLYLCYTFIEYSLIIKSTLLIIKLRWINTFNNMTLSYVSAASMP